MACASCQQNNQVVTNQTNCDCACGCVDPVCPTPQPCTEITDSKCIIYTDPAIICGLDTVVTANSSVSTALNSITSYFCANGGGGGGTGPAGPIGPAGVQGIQGVAGPTGPQGTAGSAGGAGTTGATGPQGAQGVPGPIGPAGLNWQGSWSPLGIYAPDDAVGFNGASWFCLNAVGPFPTNPLLDPTNWALLASQGAVGPTGPTGAAGVAGAAGATGPQGVAGSAGAQGAQGIPGPTGAQGIQGIQGVPGSGTAQNTWLTFNSTAGNVSANSPNEVITFVGQKEINTSISGQTVTINSWRYEIGEYVNAQGGVIYHRWISSTPGGPPGLGATQNYLIVDLVDLSVGTNVQWATAYVDIANAESTNTGSLNTALMIAAGAPAGITTGTAAVLCDSSTNWGQIDWYLPAVDELSKLYSNRFEVQMGLSIVGGTELNFNSYWSSTEYDATLAYQYSFTNGYTWVQGKTSGSAVRAVRRFSI